MAGKLTLYSESLDFASLVLLGQAVSPTVQSHAEPSNLQDLAKGTEKGKDEHKEDTLSAIDESEEVCTTTALMSIFML